MSDRGHKVTGGDVTADSTVTNGDGDSGANVLSLDSGWCSRNALAARLGVSPRTITRRMHKGSVERMETPRGFVYRVTPSDAGDTSSVTVTVGDGDADIEVTGGDADLVTQVTVGDDVTADTVTSKGVQGVDTLAVDASHVTRVVELADDVQAAELAVVSTVPVEVLTEVVGIAHALADQRDAEALAHAEERRQMFARVEALHADVLQAERRAANAEQRAAVALGVAEVATASRWTPRRQLEILRRQLAQMSD